jgi:hypothetical protein
MHLKVTAIGIQESPNTLWQAKPQQQTAHALEAKILPQSQWRPRSCHYYDKLLHNHRHPVCIEFQAAASPPGNDCVC